MRYSFPKQHGRLRALGLSLIILTLWGCAGAPEQDSTPAETPVVEQPVKQQALSFALPASEFSTQFNTAEQALTGFDWMAASVALDKIPDEGLSADDNTYLGYLQARIAYVRGDQ